MDSACYDSTDNIIIGVRGGRLFKCSATDGSVILQTGSALLPDYTQLSLGAACVCWDSGTNRCFATSWNQSRVDFVNFRKTQSIYRIVPSTLVIEASQDVDTLFNGTAFGIPGALTWIEAGIVNIRADGGNLYALAYFGNTKPDLYFLRVSATAWGSPAAYNIGGSTSSFSFAKGTRSGDDIVLAALPSIGNWLGYNWTTAAGLGNAGSYDVNCVEYDPGMDRVYAPEEFQFINVFTAAGVYSSTVNTGRSTFNGVNIRRNSNDGLLYIAGGNDNTVCVLNPVTNAFTIKTGFDLPWDFVFTPTKKFAVQQGSTPLKEVT